MKISLKVFLLPLFLSASVWALPGDLDTTFNGTGKVVMSFSKLSDEINDIALQSDGKIVAVGRLWNPNGSQTFVMARFNSDGTLDSSFGTGGEVTTSFGTQYSWANAVKIQPDGKIVACGLATDNVTGTFAIARYLPDGSLDPDFSGDGKVTLDFGTGDAAANDVVIQYDGKIVAVGVSNGAAGVRFALARYNSDGTLDTAFGTGGKVTTSFGTTGASTAYSVKAQPDGKLVVAGVYVKGNQNYFAVARYRLSGTLDRVFNLDGKLTLSFGPGLSIPFDVEVDSTGRILIGGTYINASNIGYFALARYTSKGLPDPFFDYDGAVLTPVGSRDSVIYDLAIQPDGKIIAGGEARDLDQQYNNSFLARYNENGSLDTGFGTGGKVQTALSNENDQISALVLQSNGRIVAGGAFVSANESDFALMRYLGDGSPASDDKNDKVKMPLLSSPGKGLFNFLR